MSVSKPLICFFSSCLFTKFILQVIERVYVVYSSWFSWRLESLVRFDNEGPRFFSRIAATMISKRFVKLGVKAYFWIYKYEVKITRILFNFVIYSSWDRTLKKGRVKLKIVRKSSFGDIIFLTSHAYIWLLFFCFLCCAKGGIVAEISKVKLATWKIITIIQRW